MQNQSIRATIVASTTGMLYDANQKRDGIRWALNKGASPIVQHGQDPEGMGTDYNGTILNREGQHERAEHDKNLGPEWTSGQGEHGNDEIIQSQPFAEPGQPVGQDEFMTQTHEPPAQQHLPNQHQIEAQFAEHDTDWGTHPDQTIQSQSTLPAVPGQTSGYCDTCGNPSPRLKEGLCPACFRTRGKDVISEPAPGAVEEHHSLTNPPNDRPGHTVPVHELGKYGNRRQADENVIQQPEMQGRDTVTAQSSVCPHGTDLMEMDCPNCNQMPFGVEGAGFGDIPSMGPSDSSKGKTPGSGEGMTQEAGGPGSGKPKSPTTQGPDKSQWTPQQHEIYNDLQKRSFFTATAGILTRAGLACNANDVRVYAIPLKLVTSSTTPKELAYIIATQGSSNARVAARISEGWGEGGAYKRDVEADGPEDVWKLHQSVSGKEVDWTPRMPTPMDPNAVQPNPMDTPVPQDPTMGQQGPELPEPEPQELEGSQYLPQQVQAALSAWL